jgi:signal transduction histidine kinase
MKPRFGYLYGAFIISLGILVLLSFLFYQKVNTSVGYNDYFERSHNVILQIAKLKSTLTEMESSTRGFMLTRDSAFLRNMPYFEDSVTSIIDSLKILVEDDDEQLRRVMLMHSTVKNRINVLSINLNRFIRDDSTGLVTSLTRGKSIMDNFMREAQVIEGVALKRRGAKNDTKQLFENITPNYFNIILIFAGVITLVSFVFINREVRMRFRYQKELERKLHELNRSNSELEQFTFVASHDLQEPLRKIRTFTDRLQYKHGHELNTDAAAILNRIHHAAERMQDLIQDMVNFTTLVSKEEELSDVDLNTTIRSAMREYAKVMEDSKAQIHAQPLPVITGYSEQLLLLFRSLLDNAFKFSKPGEPPVINIRAEQMYGNQGPNGSHLDVKYYHKITIEDNGIGFDNEFAEKIFMIFQRLHTQESDYSGKGIGLAIAQRVMANHNGFIIATGTAGSGASFMMYFPVEN